MRLPSSESESSKSESSGSEGENHPYVTQALLKKAEEDMGKMKAEIADLKATNERAVKMAREEGQRADALSAEVRRLKMSQAAPAGPAETTTVSCVAYVCTTFSQM